MRAQTVGPWLVAMMALAAIPQPASACGGCFHPVNPTGTVSVVSAHRMAFLSSPTESVLWDQIQFTGRPNEFAWVLPVMGNPTVEVADNGFFEALVGETTITMTGPLPPPTFCPDPCAPYGSSAFGCGCSASAPSFAGDAGTAVHVLHEGVVGPYETATIASTDPNALFAWLGAHGYEVPLNVEPTIAYYVGLGMSFVALRLRPNTGVDRMAPVRIRSPGLSLMLPLRMIAAGVGSSVDLELFVFAEARMQTVTFPNAEVDRAAITYDWATRKFDYDARFEDALFSGIGTRTNWVTEYARTPDAARLSGFRSGVAPDLHSAFADMRIVTDAIRTPFLTRLRTRLTSGELDTDLTLGASDGGEIGTSIIVTREANRAPDPVCEDYCASSDGTSSGSSTVRGSGGSCSTSQPRGRSLSALGAMMLAAGAFVIRRRRGR
jgi:hypothetical protein